MQCRLQKNGRIVAEEGVLKETMCSIKILILTLLTPMSVACQNSAPKAVTVAAGASLPSLAEKTVGMQHMAGLLPLDWDARSGKLFLEIPTPGKELLYTNSLPYGTGSNDLGLDRGQISDGHIVRFDRVGPQVFLVAPNEMFRSSATSGAEQLTVRQSFPESILAGFQIEAEDPNGAVLVDATSFFERDVHGVSEMLARLKQGTYKVDPVRSAIALESTRAFPKNTEVEAILTLTADGPVSGEFVRDVTPDPHAITLHEHQSFVELPGAGYVPRRFDPRAGYFPISYRDYSVPLGASLDQKFIERHRLIKKDPTCRTACVAESPIQYYVDRGAPEPIRTALVDGARWWDQAFQTAGWAPGTFKVDVLPEGADPMDIRYNMIQWVHRYTRGWSYGAAVTDPRTGEIIKGNVTLGSLRGRQDYLIAEALLAPYGAGKPASAKDDPMLAMVLARIRQLSAHETGHTLGLAHNFAASSFPHTLEESVSVMDYPHAWITLDPQGRPDLAHAYAKNIGLWDKVAIDFGYRQFDAVEDEAAGLDKILTDSEKTGLVYITDEDARPLGGAHPHGHLWDNGGDPAEELDRVIGLRAAALSQFGEANIRTGTPMAQLEETLVPLYLLHRYQMEAAVKEIGGLDYRYKLRGDMQINPTLVSAADQRKALAAVLKTLSPEFLTLPESLLKTLPPMPPGMERTRESMPAETGLTFDPVASAEAAADLTLSALFDPQRASRLVQYRARDGDEPSLAEVIDAAVKATRPVEAGDPRLGGVVQQAVYLRLIEALLRLAADQQASSGARVVVAGKLAEMKRKADTSSVLDSFVARRIEEFDADPKQFAPSPKIEAPPGMPIGDDQVL